MARILAAAAASVLLLAGCSDNDVASSGDPVSTSTPSSSAPSRSPSEGFSTETDDDDAEDPAPPISVLGLAEQKLRGDRLRIGAVRSQTSEYTSYDVNYRSRDTTRQGVESYRITGVLNIPNGNGPFPAVVLAHGYIDPAVYVRGQGMERERDYLATRDYIALHVDYRNHAGSDNDPLYQVRMRLGYSADVINAVKALRASSNVPVEDDNIFIFGRSMGGGVVLKALVAEPGLTRAAVAYSSVSSMEADNYDQFIRPDPEDSALRDRLARRHGTPEENPGFWRQNSSRPYFDRITEPVLLVHGRLDTTCPPPWAKATQRALVDAGVNSRLVWYRDEHAFIPHFYESMDRIISFFDRQASRHREQ
ncbi:MAG TPA: prolyl oligopeptidase family serine peptidase [Actinomycetes bacterium]|nr:prolyl oligopeptidase family serine peptidase [Actinomycetes bacterium]